MFPVVKKLLGLHLTITLIVSGVFSLIHQWLRWEVLDNCHTFLDPELTFLNVLYSPANSAQPRRNSIHEMGQIFIFPNLKINSVCHFCLINGK